MNADSPFPGALNLGSRVWPAVQLGMVEWAKACGYGKISVYYCIRPK